MTIAAAEDWLVAVCKDTLGDAVTVLTGPGAWDGSYLEKLLTSLPAVVITWDGGTAADSTSLTLNATWTLYIITGWQGGDEATRRRAATKGAYVIFTALAVRLHKENMGQRQYTAAGTGGAVANIPDPEALDGFGHLIVVDITNEWSGEWDRVGVSIYALELQQNMPLLGVDSASFDDWLRTNMTIDIEGGEEFDPDAGDEIGVDGDATSADSTCRKVNGGRSPRSP